MRPHDPQQPFLPYYETLRLLGEGGVATVYQVRDTRDGSVRALKALKHTGDKILLDVERFEQEYRILSSLHHPTLPEVFDYGILADGTRFIVMEYIEGMPLNEYCDRNRGDFWLQLYELSEALAFIHERGLLHLDLKPANILVRRTLVRGDEERPMVTLLDFGLSYRRDAAPETMVVGTPGYISPEVVRGEEELTRAADYYSLGVTLYELIEGRLPFNGTVQEVLDAHLNQRVSFGSQKVEYAELYPHIERLMSPDTKERLEAFGDFRRSMAARVAGETLALEQVFGLGYLNSLGTIGKNEVWDTLRDWARGLGDRMESIRMQAGAVVEPDPDDEDEASDSSAPDGGDTVYGDDGMVPPIVQKSKVPENGFTDLLKTTVRLRDGVEYAVRKAKEKAAQRHRRLTRVDLNDIPRAVLISGPAGSGKSFLVSALRTELLMRGIRVTTLGEGGGYESLVTAGGPFNKSAPDRPVDPRAMIIDRFVRGWDRLAQEAADNGVVLIVDSYSRMDKELREFFEYVCRRIALRIDEGDDSKILIVVTGRNPQLMQELRGVLPHGKGDELLIPPPTSRDVEAILAQFHGHMTGVEDRQKLRECLARSGGTSDALLARLKEALVSGELERVGGKWRFTPDPAHTQEEQDVRYYATLLENLVGPERELIVWLSCHPEALLVDDFMALTGFDNTQLAEARERIEPYRVIDHREVDERGERIALVSVAVRDAFYKAVDKNEREKIHRACLDYFGERERETEQWYRLMGHHYDRVGMLERALAMRIKALRKMMQANDVFGARQLCAEGLAITSGLKSGKLRKRKKHLERYFIKQWLRVEWSVSNYSSIVEVVRTNYTKRRRAVPISFYYKYGTALEKCGALTACKKLIAIGKKKIFNKSTKPFILLRLLEASVKFASGDFVGCIRVLGQIDTDSPALDDFTLARTYILYMLSYECLGDRVGYERYMMLGQLTAEKAGDYEQLLAVSYSRILSLINSSLYEKAKRDLRDAIRTANKHRVYRPLSSLYFLASALYYEEGNYKKSLAYLDKAVRVVTNLGMTQLVNDYMLRYALIYQNIGHYGNAIHFAETAKKQLGDGDKTGSYFFALLILFDLHNCMNNTRADEYKAELDEIAPGVNAKYRVALYHHLTADYHFERLESKEAVKHYETARSMYQTIGYDDDAVRCAVKVAEIYVSQKNVRKSWEVLETLHGQIGKMESTNLIAEYYMARLRFHRLLPEDLASRQKTLLSCSEIRSLIRDKNVMLRMEGLLYWTYEEMNMPDNAAEAINAFYSHLNEIVSNLPTSDYISQYVRGREISALLDQLELLKKKDPDRVLV
jgi:tRNA A-37 threonylcarbamoyl transferase component Bud32/tetratricopeptide (TPR) repeat protein